MLRIRRLDNGERTDLSVAGISVPGGPVWLRVSIHGRRTQFSWSVDGKTYEPIGPVFDTSTLSDEYCRYGEFTGAFVGLVCEDSLFRTKIADFDVQQRSH